MPNSWEESGSDRRGRGTGLALGGFALLLTTIEFLFGLWANLYEQDLPPSMQDVFTSPYLSIDRALVGHVLVGLLLGITALGLVVWAAMRRRRHVLFSAVGGLLGVLIAAIGGAEFIAKGDPIYSFLMGLGFLLATGAYFRVMQVLRRPSRVLPPGWTPSAGGIPPGPATPP